MRRFIGILFILIVVAAIGFTIYALLADRLRHALKRPALITWITRAGGSALIAMGIATATVRRSTT